MLKDERMMAVYNAIRAGVTVCDVGTDHAIIPIELILSGKSERCIITDISAPSLEKGVNNAKKAGCKDKISAYHTNGTLDVPFDSEMDFIIAGMGGELIARIIAQDARLKNPEYRFVLQPMSRAEELRLFLAENGFEVTKENKIASAGRIYPVIECKYAAYPYTISTAVMLLGFEKAQTELERQYAKRVLYTLETKLSGLKSAEKTDLEQISEIESNINAVKKSLE